MQLHRAKKDIEEAGGHLVVIGNGTPNYIAGFREKTGYRGELYTDPERRAYRALELRHDKRSSLSVGALKSAVSALRGGHRQGAVQGDAWQQGGIFVVGPDDRVRYAYRSRHAGDHPPVGDVLAALRRAS